MVRSLGIRGLIILVAVPLLVVLVLALQRDQQRAADAESAALQLGRNDVALQAGEYEIWLETEARPEVLPTPSAFEFDLRPTDGTASARVDRASVSAGLPASEPGRFLWKLAEVNVHEGGEFELTGEQVEEAPSGQLLLLPG